MATGNGIAKVGKEDSVKAAKHLEAQGLIVKIGEFEGNAIYHITDQGKATVKLPHGRLEGFRDRLQSELDTRMTTFREKTGQ
jgi:DNA-binding PadR family transcriptional regulator